MAKDLFARMEAGKTKKIGHSHGFGEQCFVCLHLHPESHAPHKRRTRRERRLRASVPESLR